MRDRIGKYLLITSETARNSRLSALSGIKITSSKLLDQHVKLVDRMKEVFKSFKDFDLDFHYQWNKQKNVDVLLNGKKYNYFCFCSVQQIAYRQ
jgi:hypothetical protein